MKGKNEELRSLISKCQNEMPKEEMTIDRVLEVKGFGLSQCILLVLLSFVALAYFYQTLFMYYAGNSPPWKCVSNTSGFCATNYGKEFDSSSDDFTKRCGMKRSEWQYTTQKDYSIVTEYELVCSREYLNALINASFFIGWGIIGLITGMLSDKYGRKRTLVISFLLLCLFSVLSSFVTSIWQLGILRALLGGCVGSIIAALFIYASEVTPPKYRSVTMNIMLSFNSISLLLLSVLAMYVKNWRRLGLYAVVPSTISIVVLSFLPESPRWLHAIGRVKQAEDALLKITFTNCAFFYLNDEIKEEDSRRKYSYVDLFCNWPILRCVLLQSYLWLTANFVYYGLSLESSHLGSNIYQNFMLSMIADIVGNTSAVFICNWLGRRKTSIVSFLLCGVCLSGEAGAISSSFTFGVILRIGLAMVGKIFINLSFSNLFIWSAELNPTIIRSKGLTITQLGGQIGAITAPFATSVLQSAYKPLPFIIMAICSIIACLDSFILPETHMKPTREKFEDIS